MPGADKQATTETTTRDKRSQGFTAAERAAMKARALEQKAAATREAGEHAVREALAAMPAEDRALGERLHALITATAPALTPKTWYGMPAYARDGLVVCFFQSAAKFKTRYATIGFNDVAGLDDGAMWPVAFALTTWNADVETRIRALVQQAVS